MPTKTTEDFNPKTGNTRIDVMLLGVWSAVQRMDFGDDSVLMETSDALSDLRYHVEAHERKVEAEHHEYRDSQHSRDGRADVRRANQEAWDIKKNQVEAAS